MDPRIKFFGNEAITRGLFDVAVFQQILDHIEKDAGIVAFAQVIIDNEIISDFKIVQEIVDLAEIEFDSQVERKESTPTDAGTIKMSDIHGISQKSDEFIASFMLTLLKLVRELGASDLHLSANSTPFMRLNLEIQCLDNNLLSAEDADKINMALLTAEQKEEFKSEKDIDVAIQLGDNVRIRANIMVHKEGVAGTYRMMHDHVKSLEELSFSADATKTISKMLNYHNGLILVAGPIGSGKTTTLASLIKMIDSKRKEHVITVEDPIEVIQASTNCNITQRQVGLHTNSFSAALKGALREDPDIIVIGELRDLETIEMAITASETGHLVIGTLHTNNASNTLNRILDVFPPSQQQQIRTMTAGSLRGIICQQLLPSTDGKITVACEILINHIAVSNIINDGKTHLLKQVIQTGSKQGMCSMDQSILKLFLADTITKEIALKYITDEAEKQQVNQHLANKAAQEAEAQQPQKKKGWF